MLLASAATAREGAKAANPISGEAIKKKGIAKFAAQALRSFIFSPSVPLLPRLCLARFAAVISKAIEFDQKTVRELENRHMRLNLLQQDTANCALDIQYDQIEQFITNTLR